MTSPWTPEPPSFDTWNVEAGTLSPWMPDARSYTGWSTETLGSTIRLTEAGSVRITEQGTIRIIEHFDIKWSNESPTFDPWTQE